MNSSTSRDDDVQHTCSEDGIDDNDNPLPSSSSRDSRLDAGGDPADAKFCHNLLKVELHAHLHGSIRNDTLLDLSNKNGCKKFLLEDVLVKDADRRTLKDCFYIFDQIHGAVKYLEDLERITLECLDDFARDNVVYLELRTTPRVLKVSGSDDDARKEDCVRCLLCTILKWRDRQRTNKCGGVVMDARVLLSIDRRGSLEDAVNTVNLVRKINSPLIVGIDLGGNPTVGRGEFTRRYLPALQLARSLGIKLTVHSAEVWDDDGVDEINDILKFSPERVGHLVCIAKDQLQEFLDSPKRPSIEICLTSNLKTRPELFNCISNHPLRNIIQTEQLSCADKNATSICICTDDCGVFQSTLSNEYEKAAIALKLSRSRLYEIALSAVDGIFADDSVKHDLRTLLRDQMNKITEFLQ